MNCLYARDESSQECEFYVMIMKYPRAQLLAGSSTDSKHVEFFIYIEAQTFSLSGSL
jgi:hypothetical protein